MREEIDAGTTSDKIERARLYIKLVQEKLAVEEKKVQDQKKQVELAEKNLEVAKAQLKEREKERDKLIEHKKEWTKEALKEFQVMEIRAEDDLGSTMFLSRMTQRRQDERRPSSQSKKKGEV
jgi:cellobiose-specific phosphotransferase system component IIA